MAGRASSRFLAALGIFLLAFCGVESGGHERSYALSSTGKPLVKRPPGRSFKVVMFVDGGGVRGIIPVMILLELEHSIKQYLLNHPHLLPAHASISTVDDFDINLVDYVDCMTALSGGSWTVTYLASRGGQGASRRVLDDPAIVEKYGVIPTGATEGLRVFYREYATVIYPFATLDPNAGVPFDLSNPQAPGVSSTVFTLEGLETALEAFLGNTTLEDVDTSLLIPTVDLITGYTVFFVQNIFRDPPVTSSAKLTNGDGPRPLPSEGSAMFSSHLIFDEGKNYYLTDVAAAASSVPALQPAKPVSEVGNDTMEYLLVDGIFPFEILSIPAAFFVSAESGVYDLQKLAILSVGTGLATSDISYLADAGLATWLEGFQLTNLFIYNGVRSLTSLMDYIYYSNPSTKPYQYLRVTRQVPITTEVGMLLDDGFNAAFMDTWEEIGRSIGQEYRPAIDVFVRDFIFG